MFIDGRAGSREFLSLLKDYAEETTLEYGDTLILGNGPDGPVTVGVEIKSISDLLSSEATGRLAGHQIPGMLEAYDYSWLLYFGSYRLGTGGRLEVRHGASWRTFRLGSRPVPYGYLENFLLTIQTTGMRIKHCFNQTEAAAWLVCLERWWGKDWTSHKALRKFDESHDGRALMTGLSSQQEQVARVAKELPGIGVDRAIAVALHFRSVEVMVNATEVEWQKIRGIGKGLAKTVVAAIRG